jgi:hypothetical protein
LWSETSATSAQPIYCEWMGLSGGGILFASCSFEGTFWKTIFLVEGYLLFVFLSFGFFG